MTRSRSRLAAPFAVMAAALLVASAPVAAAAVQIGRFPLTGELANTVSTKVRLTKLGDPAFVAGTGRDGNPRQLLQVESGEGLAMINIPKTARGSYTIEITLQPDQVDSYERILSFGPNDRDAGLYFRSGGIYLYPQKTDVADTPIVNGEWVRVRVARNGETGQMQVYWDTDATVWAFNYKDSGKRYLLRNGIVDLFQDDGSEHFSGNVGRIAIWKGYKPITLGID